MKLVELFNLYIINEGKNINFPNNINENCALLICNSKIENKYLEITNVLESLGLTVLCLNNENVTKTNIRLAFDFLINLQKSCIVMVYLYLDSTIY